MRAKQKNTLPCKRAGMPSRHLSQRRRLNAQRIEEEQNRVLRAQLKQQIKKRLEEVPESWKRLYREKLEEHGVNPHASIDHVNDLESLQRRKALLPPVTTYRQHVNPRHPSRPEHRALACKLLDGHTRDYVAKVCSNDRIIRDALTRPQGTSVRRFRPENVAHLKLDTGKGVCVHPNNVKQMNKNGFQIAANYQKDAKAGEWPEVRVDVPFTVGQSGIGWTPGETLQVRLPYHVARECQIDLKPQQNRLQHPTHPDNAR